MIEDVHGSDIISIMVRGICSISLSFSLILYTTFISSQKPSVVPGNGPGTSNDTKNLPDVSMALVR